MATIIQREAPRPNPKPITRVSLVAHHYPEDYGVAVIPARAAYKEGVVKFEIGYGPNIVTAKTMYFTATRLELVEFANALLELAKQEA